MGITFTLPVPLRNQLGEVTTDGKPNENDHYNCVATSIADALTFRLKRPYYGDQLKDAIYGQGYQGGQAAVRYVSYCANLGVPLQAINGSQDALIVALHHEIEAGNPCLVTMPSQWGSAPSQPGWNPVAPNGWTHVGLACGDGAGWLRVMNPWGGFWHDGSDDYWRIRLCYGQIWRVGPVRSMTMAWHEQANKTGRDDKGHVCGEGMMNVLQSRPDLASADGLMSERFRDGNNSVLALANGHFVRSHHDPATGQWTNVADDAGGLALLVGIVSDLDAKLAAVQSAPQNAPLTPYQQACIAAAEADMAATSALASATALRGK